MLSNIGPDIREATSTEKLSILDEPQITANLGHSLKDTLLNLEVPFYLVTFKQYRLLFMFYEVGPDVYEIHIFCPKDSIRGSRVLALAAVDWITKIAAPDIRVLITNCPEGKMANMVRKLGGTEIKKEGGVVHFMYLVRDTISESNYG